MTNPTDRDGAIERVKIRVLPDGRVNNSDSASYVGFSIRTLNNLRVQGKGPKYIKVGGRIFSTLAWLDAYIRGEAA